MTRSPALSSSNPLKTQQLLSFKKECNFRSNVPQKRLIWDGGHLGVSPNPERGRFWCSWPERISSHVGFTAVILDNPGTSWSPDSPSKRRPLRLSLDLCNQLEGSLVQYTTVIDLCNQLNFYDQLDWSLVQYTTLLYLLPLDYNSILYCSTITVNTKLYYYNYRYYSSVMV
jgi:hypothetical protein